MAQGTIGPFAFGVIRAYARHLAWRPSFGRLISGSPALRYTDIGDQSPQRHNDLMTAKRTGGEAK